MTDYNMELMVEAFNNIFKSIGSFGGFLEGQSSGLGALIAMLFMLGILIGIGYLFLKWMSGRRRRI